MEKRRIRLEINGVVCGLITQESEEYMNSIAQEVGTMMREVLDASPFVTREAAALTAALSYCDDARKNAQRISELQERIDELEVEAELRQEEKAGLSAAPSQPAETTAPAEASMPAEAPVSPPEKEQPDRPRAEKRKNPLRHEEDFQQQGFVSFFEKP